MKQYYEFTNARTATYRHDDSETNVECYFLYLGSNALDCVVGE